MLDSEGFNPCFVGLVFSTCYKGRLVRGRFFVSILVLLD